MTILHLYRKLFLPVHLLRLEKKIKKNKIKLVEEFNLIIQHKFLIFHLHIDIFEFVICFTNRIYIRWKNRQFVIVGGSC